jgi:hypothetical protein
VANPKVGVPLDARYGAPEKKAVATPTTAKTWSCWTNVRARSAFCVGEPPSSRAWAMTSLRPLMPPWALTMSK